MNTAKEILQKIKAIFEEVPAPVEPVQMEAKEYSLADGTKVMIDKLEVGGLVTVEGNPAPEGTHMLADGSSVLLDAAGAIVAITPAEVEEPEMPEVMQDARVDALQTQLAAQEKEIAKQKQAFIELVSLVEKLAEEPAAAPIEPQKNQFSKPKEEKAERLAKFQSVLTQIKNK